jgi:hypothetical protein
LDSQTRDPVFSLSPLYCRGLFSPATLLPGYGQFL